MVSQIVGLPSGNLLKRKKSLPKQILSIALGFMLCINVCAISGVWHAGTGYDDLYGSSEVTTDPCERSPRDPVAGDTVYIKSTTWPIESGDAVWVTWTLNGVNQTVINASWQYNSGNNTYWQATLGTFSKGDAITYTVHANQNGQGEVTSKTYSFVVTAWDYVQNVSSFTNYNNRVEFTCTSNSGTLNPKISFCFPGSGYFRMQFEPLGSGSFATGLTNYTVDSSNPSYVMIYGPSITLKVYKSPYRLQVYDSSNNLLATEYDRSLGRSLAFLTNGSNYVSKVEENLYSATTESFTGFGMKYNSLNQRGNNVDIYTVNWYLDQNEKTYLPIPFYYTNSHYGVYLNSTYYTQFRLATDATDKATIRANAGGYTNTNMDLYFFGGTPTQISESYTDVTGKPKLPPVWAFGPWISANEWNKQSEAQDQITQTNNYNIPTTAMVLEAWSDEDTYYIWGGASYTAQSGSWMPSSSDFTYGGSWPSPQTLINNAHNSGIKVVLWQLPLVRYTSTPSTQLTNDTNYAIANNYFLGDGYGGVYRRPDGWFGNSPLIDFTYPSAVNWFLGKRTYLLRDMGIDGFKCDGGEFVWGRNITSYAGIKGDQLRNVYPDYYVDAYYDFLQNYNTNTVTFSRAGGIGASQHPITWTGDQRSTFSAYQDSIRAELTASMSGVNFVTTDLAGFNGAIPTTELYKRAVAQACFSPIMQLHSESGGDPSPSVARTPWNMYAQTGDYGCISVYQKFGNIRMSLIPYLYNEAKYTGSTGTALMKSMTYAYPDDTTAQSMVFQYLLGNELLVAPVESQGQTTKSIYLPEGEWIDLFYGARRPGNTTISYYAGLDTIPVFVKAGSILPLNLDADYTLGNSVGNSVTSYNNLTFRIYPKGTTSYDWYDYVDSTQRNISVTENYASSQISISSPAMNRTSTLQVYSGKPGTVWLNSVSATQYTTLSSFKSAASGWYYDAVHHLTFIKVPSATSNTSVVLSSVHEVPFEAEYATLNNVSTNTNHTGYQGTGFVDGFADSGDYVEFNVYSDSDTTYSMDVRYSAGAYAASRSLSVNGVAQTSLSLPKTTDWDTWGTVTRSVTLHAGENLIRISYGSSDYTGINLDNITLRKN